MVYVGVDIGDTRVGFRAEHEDGRVDECTFEWPSAADLAHDIDAIAGGVDRLRSEWSAPPVGVGVAMAGTVDGRGRVVQWRTRPHWRGLDLSVVLRDLFPGTPVRWMDDRTLAAVALADELGCPDLVYLRVGEDIGGGVALNGRPLFDDGRPAPEIGHMIVERYGPQCGCGRQGCLQAVAAGPPTLSRACRRRGIPVTVADLRLGVERNEMWAVSAVDDSCTAVAAAVISLGELVRPALVVIGGEFAAAIDTFVPTVADYVADLARAGCAPLAVRGVLPDGVSALRGAVLLARG